MFTHNAGTIKKMSSATEKTESIIGNLYAGRVLELVNSATSSIDILMFEWRWYENDFSHPIQIINHALVRAVRRGVKVRALTHRSEIAKRLQSVGIEAKAWPLQKLMHSKMIIFDKKAVVIGSHNLTGSAINTNIETSVLFFDREVAEAKLNYINNLWLS